MYTPETRAKIERELSQAESARAGGNEGQARVCARRAAGAAVRAFFEQRQQPAASPSVIDLLNQLRVLPGLPEQVYATLDHLLMRVNSDYELPVPVDLIEETRWLINELETSRINGS